MSWKGQFAELTSKTHSEQGIWLLNGFWEEGFSDKAEEVWTMVHQFIECQIDGPVLYGSKTQDFTEASDLDEFKSSRILEIMGETMTVIALRKRLKDIDIDNNKKMAISEYFVDKFNIAPEKLVNSPQGDVDPVELAAAIDKCDKASDALAQAADDAQAAQAALRASQQAAADAAQAVEAAVAAAAVAAEKKGEADAALVESEAAEAVVRAAEAELQASIDEIEALEKAKTDKIAKCQAIIDDPSAGTVKKGRAVQEKEQTLSEDPLPLRKAKITQGAALKKVTKARKAAEEVTAKSAAAAKAAADAKDEADTAQAAAEAAKQAADEAEQAAEAAKQTADDAAVAAEAALVEAQAALDELKAKGTGSPQGKLWWLERVLKEKKKFMR